VQQAHAFGSMAGDVVNEHSTSHQLLWYIDSFVLQNPPSPSAKPLWAILKPFVRTYEPTKNYLYRITQNEKSNRHSKD